MPEFEEENPNASQSESYTPSIDASKKPRTRRRSGGFKTEVASVSNAKMGEVSASEALKGEKLSGKPTPSQARTEKEDKPRRERSERKPREPRGEQSERKPREPRSEQSEREPRQKREPRTDANPQPSAETLAAIASVEAKIAERRAERDARRAERNKNRPAKSERKPSQKRASDQKTTPQKSQGGLMAAISGFFGKLIGKDPKPAPRKSASGNKQNRDGRPQNKGGNRGGQNRGRGGNGGGQGRKRGGKGPRRSDSRSKENVAS